MGKISSANAQLNAVVSKHLKEVVDARADALHLTPSSFATLIFEDWEARQFPAVSDSDGLTAPGVMKRLRDRWIQLEKQATEKKLGAHDLTGLNSIKLMLSDPLLAEKAAASGQKRVLAELRKQGAAFLQGIAAEKTA